jgi:biopolymer transport protein ExbD
MARTFHRPRRITALNEINMTPLIDLAFALLIIFIISTPLLEQTIPLNLPSEQQARAPSDERPQFINLSIDRSGQYFWDSDPVSPAEMDTRLADIRLSPEPPVLHIRGDREIEYQRVIDLLNLIKRNNLTRISLDTNIQ